MLIVINEIHDEQFLQIIVDGINDDEVEADIVVDEVLFITDAVLVVLNDELDDIDFIINFVMVELILHDDDDELEEHIVDVFVHELDDIEVEVAELVNEMLQVVMLLTIDDDEDDDTLDDSDTNEQ